ncbi:MAG: DUF378 domain-containing protein [Candidatus Levybacteria bacterium]|nr:DUF378 domain-containing protein [Candidatus Levybacteria bacterium]
MKALHIVSFTLVIIGALNWGLLGLFNFNLVTALLGSVPSLEQIVYILVGLSALYLVFTHKNDCKICGGK